MYDGQQWICRKIIQSNPLITIRLNTIKSLLRFTLISLNVRIHNIWQRNKSLIYFKKSAIYLFFIYIIVSELFKFNVI